MGFSQVTITFSDTTVKVSTNRTLYMTVYKDKLHSSNYTASPSLSRGKKSHAQDLQHT